MNDTNFINFNYTEFIPQELVCNTYIYPDALKITMIAYGFFLIMYMAFKHKLPAALIDILDFILFVSYCGIVGMLYYSV